MDDPLVSIVTPSFNQGEYIEETIRSVVGQDYDQIEHLVIDGGSTDDTLEILRAYEDEYELDWISEPDEGQSDALNKGFRRANGEIVGWINSDDVYFDPGVVDAVIDRFSADSDLNVIYGGIAFIDEESQIFKFQFPPEFDHDVIRAWNFIPQLGTFFEASLVKEHELWTDLVFSMDYEYWLRLAQKGYSFGRMTAPLAGYRMHEAAKGPRLGLETLRKEQSELRREYGAGPRLETIVRKVERKARNLQQNALRFTDRGRTPPVLRSTPSRR